MKHIKNDCRNNKLHNLNFQSLEVVSRYRDPQLQVTENCSNLLNLEANICLNTRFAVNNSDLPW